MNEHAHVYSNPSYHNELEDGHYFCNCGGKLTASEITRRLNAMEGLRLADPVTYMALMSIVEAENE